MRRTTKIARPIKSDPDRGERAGKARAALPAIHQVLTFDQQLLRIAGDPSIPVQRLREIAELRSKIRREDAEEEWTENMRLAQAEMRPVEADAKNPQTNSEYATLYAVDRALRPIYSKYGFSLSFSQADGAPPGSQRTICYVSRGLYTRMYHYDCPVTTKGPKGNDVMTTTHAGSTAFSYSKRYLILAIFNVSIGDPKREDNDGNIDAGLLPINEKQVAELVKLVADSGADTKRFCDLFNVESIDQIIVLRFNEAKAQLMRKLRDKKARAKAAASDFPGDKPL